MLKLTPKWYTPLIWLLLIGEVIFNWIIIQRVPYTEIDWEAYMSQVGPEKGYLGGEWDYTHLNGGTGPCVYPAGYVYIFSLLNLITDKGTDIILGQYIWAVLYIVFILFVLAIYKKTRRIEPEMLFILCMSKRIHSIFVLRLFNDCFSMLFLYIAVYFFIHRKWTTGCLILSFAVSIKMNILLFSIGVGVLMLQSIGFWKTLLNVILCFLVQLILSIPFLIANPSAYISRAFNFGRKFLHVWTVNFKFLPEDVFRSDALALGLLIGTAVSWLALANFKWCSQQGGLLKVLYNSLTGRYENTLKSKFIAYVIFTSNFVGIVFSRSLHFQFYVWYFHTLPFILWSINVPVIIKLFILGVIESIWNIYPSTPTTSISITVIHLVLLISLFVASKPPRAYSKPKIQK